MSLQHLDTGLESAHTTATPSNTEKGAPDAEPSRNWKARRVCGVPLLWMLVVVIVLVIGGTVGGVVGSVSSKKSSKPDESTLESTANSTVVGDHEDSPLQPPWQDKWYYIKNELIIPGSQTVVKFDLPSEKMTVGYSHSQPATPPSTGASSPCHPTPAHSNLSRPPTTSPSQSTCSITDSLITRTRTLGTRRTGYGWSGTRIRGMRGA